MTDTTTCFWYQPCPRCDGQGRLIIKKYLDTGALFFCCDECMRCWNNNDDLENQQNTFMEYTIKSDTANATESDIAAFGWQSYMLHRCCDTFIGES